MKLLSSTGVLLLSSKASIVFGSSIGEGAIEKEQERNLSNNNCPPKVASRSEEVMTLCARAGISGFSIDSSTYTCGTSDEGYACEGTIDQSKQLPTCSQPTVSSCANTDVYNSGYGSVGHDGSVKDGIGPCSYESIGSSWESFYCDNDEQIFACFDDALGEWCEGTVLGTPSPTYKPTIPRDLKFTCPPDIVYSYDEASYYCTASELGSMGWGNGYNCDWNALIACEGTINPKKSQTPECSAPVASCNDIDMYICDDLSTSFMQKTCDDNKLYQFECFDKNLNQWCAGKVLGGNGGSSKSNTYVPPEERNKDEYLQQSHKTSSSTAHPWNDKYNDQDDDGWNRTTVVLVLMACACLGLFTGRSISTLYQQNRNRNQSDRPQDRRIEIGPIV